MSYTLVVDDNEGLLDSLATWATRLGYLGITFCKSLAEARKAIVRGEKVFQRIVADQVFEGEEDDGLTFLEDVRARDPAAECFLMTGKPITEGIESRLRALNGRLIEKAALNLDTLRRLLADKPFEGATLPPSGDLDIGELRLELEAAKAALDEMRTLNDLLIEDIVAELDAVPDPQRRALLIGSRLLSPAQLKEEVRERTPIGRELIRLHHELFTRLRRKK